jgi:predicted nucleotidyltransferase
MDASLIIAKVAAAIEAQQLEAILIGNAAAALHGAPVTTIDLDFFIRRTPANKKKMEALAASLGATLYRPFYPASRVVRLMNDDATLQVDLMDEVSGIRSFEGVRKRAMEISVEGATVRVAALADIIKSKRAANRPRDLAVLEILEKTLEAKEAHAQGTARGTKNPK